MSYIQVSHLTFAYEGSYDNIFEDVSFRIDTNWKLGFIGRNGLGKTTFLQLLLGKYSYSGVITSDMEFEYFPYEVDNPADYTIDIIQNICPIAEDWQIYRELSLLKVSDDVLYRPFSTLSNGEQTKVLLAALFLKENSFLLIDEPTNHLDLEARMAVEQYLNRKQSFILVSHDRNFLDCCVDHILSINRTNIEIQKGNFSSWWENKRRQDEFERGQNERLKKEIHRLQDSARQSASWSDKVEKTKKGTRAGGLRPDTGFIGHKAAKMMSRSKSIEERRQRQIEEKSKLLKNVEEHETLKLSPLSYCKHRLLELSHVSLFYGEKQVCRDISFTVEQGGRIILRGPNGCGKSSILKLICREKNSLSKEENSQPEKSLRYTGNLYQNDNLIISWLPQDTSHLKGNLRDYALEQGIDESLMKAILRKLDFSRVQFEKNMEHFSDGQKKKVLIAGSLCKKAHLYIWDEPLNYIDVWSRIQLEELLNTYRPTLLLVEHDRTFCEQIGAKIISLNH